MEGQECDTDQSMPRLMSEATRSFFRSDRKRRLRPLDALMWTLVDLNVAAFTASDTNEPLRHGASSGVHLRYLLATKRINNSNIAKTDNAR